LSLNNRQAEEVGGEDREIIYASVEQVKGAGSLQQAPANWWDVPSEDLPAGVVQQLFSLFDSAASKGSDLGMLNKSNVRLGLNLHQIKSLLTKLKLMSKFDTDGDGELSVDEIFAALDADGDGNISLEEFVGGVRAAFVGREGGVVSPSHDFLSSGRPSLSRNDSTTSIVSTASSTAYGFGEASPPPTRKFIAGDNPIYSFGEDSPPPPSDNKGAVTNTDVFGQDPPLSWGMATLQFAADDVDIDDANGLCDFYFNVQNSEGETVYKSETVEKCLNPTWKQFEIEMANIDVNNTTGFTVEIWEWDRLSRHVLVGSTAVVFEKPKRWRMTNPLKVGTEGYSDSGILKLLSVQTGRRPALAVESAGSRVSSSGAAYGFGAVSPPPELETRFGGA
jgi:hypothetical protein